MGRWVTSKGRRIYIPDEGEENPFANKSKISDHITNAKSVNELHDKLKSQGLSMESADATAIKRDYRSMNGEKVSLYDKDGNEYRGTFNRYSDGGTEIVNIKKERYNTKDDDESIKQKQIAANKAQADERNGKQTTTQKRLAAIQQNPEAQKYLDSFSPATSTPTQAINKTYDKFFKNKSEADKKNGRRTTRYDDGPGTTKSDKEYMSVLKEAHEKGARLKTTREIEKDSNIIMRESRKYKKMSIKDIKALDLKSMSYIELKALETDLSSRSFLGERGAQTLKNKVAAESAKKYNPDSRFVLKKNKKKG